MTLEPIIHLVAWLCAAAGLLLAVLALLWDRSRGRRRCPRCWYDLSKSPALQCSECGHQVPSEQALFRTRRHWSWAALAAAVVLAAWIGGTWPGIRRDGWAAAFPTPVLQPALPSFAQRAQSLIDARSGPEWNRWDRLVVAALVRHRLTASNDASFGEVRELASPLAYCRAEAALAIDALAALAAQSTSPEARFFCTLTLVESLPGDARVGSLVESLLAHTTDFEEQVRLVNRLGESLMALSNAHPKAVTRLLILLVKSPSPYAVRQGALGLLNCGSAASTALPALREALAASDDEDVRDDIRMAIAAIDARHE